MLLNDNLKKNNKISLRLAHPNMRTFWEYILQPSYNFCFVL